MHMAARTGPPLGNARVRPPSAGRRATPPSVAAALGGAGNMLQLMGDEPLLVMSDSAFDSLEKDQILAIEKHCSIIHSSLDTIEACGGGSARCMMAEIFLPKQN